MSRDIDVTVTYRITLADPADPQRIIARCIDNDDGWRETFYQLRTNVDVYAHLAFNLGLNGLELPQLDGWADCAADDITIETLGHDYVLFPEAARDAS